MLTGAGSAGRGGARPSPPVSDAGHAAAPERRYRRFGTHNLRIGFRRWRRSRPFWAGVWTLLGGGLIAYVPGTAFKFALMPGSLIWAGILVGVIIVIFGLFLWVQPSIRYLLGVLIILFSLFSFITSDFGGLLLGMLLGLVGGSLAMAWIPNAPPTRRERRRARKLAAAEVELTGRAAPSGVAAGKAPAHPAR